MAAGDISKELNITKGKAHYYLRELESRKLIKRADNVNFDDLRKVYYELS